MDRYCRCSGRLVGRRACGWGRCGAAGTRTASPRICERRLVGLVSGPQGRRRRGFVVLRPRRGLRQGCLDGLLRRPEDGGGCRIVVRRARRGYGKDSWSVWFRGCKIEGLSASSFSALGDGYGKDPWKVVFEGRTVKDAAASSFESLGRGYAKDAWRVYYRGEAIPGVSPGSFRMPRR